MKPINQVLSDIKIDKSKLGVTRLLKYCDFDQADTLVKKCGALWNDEPYVKTSWPAPKQWDRDGILEDIVKDVALFVSILAKEGRS